MAVASNVPGLVNVCVRPNSMGPPLKFGKAATKLPVEKSYSSKLSD